MRAAKYDRTSNPINLLTSHVPGTVHLNGSAHREHKEEGVFFSVLLLEGIVDPQHVSRKLVDIKPPLRSRHHRSQTGTVQTLGADAHAGDPPLGFARLVRICWGCGGHLVQRPNQRNVLLFVEQKRRRGVGILANWRFVMFVLLFAASHFWQLML